MRRFKFRLQAVLEHRERIEKQAKSTYAQAQQAVQKGEAMLAELHEVRAAVLAELSEQRLSPNFDPMEAHTYQDYLKTVTTCLRDQEAYVRELHITAEALRLNLVGAATNKKVIDKIRERDLTAHHAQGVRADQAAMDELTTMRHRTLPPLAPSATEGGRRA